MKNLGCFIISTTNHNVYQNIGYCYKSDIIEKAKKYCDDLSFFCDGDMTEEEKKEEEFDAAIYILNKDDGETCRVYSDTSIDEIIDFIDDVDKLWDGFSGQALHISSQVLSDEFYEKLLLKIDSYSY